MKRQCTLEFVRIGEPNARQWYWRFLAGNGQETGRASEMYQRRVDAIRSAEVTCGVRYVLMYEDQGFCYRPSGSTRWEKRVDVRWLR